MKPRRPIVATLLTLAAALALLLLFVRPDPDPDPDPDPATRRTAPDRPMAGRTSAPPGADRPTTQLDPPTDEEMELLSKLGYLEDHPPFQWGTLVVDVVDEEGLAADRAHVIPVDCPGLGVGMPGLRRVPVGACTLRAVRRDGALLARSAPVTVEVGAVDPAYVLLELSSVRTGGIGVRFMPDAAGMRIVEVVPDSPAERAGLGPGDLVIDVGGQPTAGMQSEAFVELMTGEEGSDVTFTVGWSGDTGLVEETVTVARRFLDG